MQYVQAVFQCLAEGFRKAVGTDRQDRAICPLEPEQSAIHLDCYGGFHPGETADSLCEGLWDGARVGPTAMESNAVSGRLPVCSRVNARRSPVLADKW